jgi:large subunit ribosomal protein L1
MKKIKQGKRYQIIKSKIDSQKNYSFEEAIAILKSQVKIKFDQTVELTLKLNINSKNNDQQVKGFLLLPKNLKRKIKCAIVTDSQTELAEKTKADFVYKSSDFVQLIKVSKKLPFNSLIATPEVMPNLLKVAKKLGQKRIFPDEKSNTLTNELEKTVDEIKNKKLNYRNDRNGILHLIIGKLSFPLNDLKINYEAVINYIQKNKPKTVKKNFIKKITISATMSPGLNLLLN